MLSTDSNDYAFCEWCGERVALVDERLTDDACRKHRAEFGHTPFLEGLELDRGDLW